MQPRQTNFADLPNDVVQGPLADQCPTETITKNITVSKDWHRLFGSLPAALWKSKIIRDFNIQPYTLEMILADIKAHHGGNLPPHAVEKNICKRLWLLQKNQHRLPEYAKYIYDCRDAYQEELLLCCADEVTLIYQLSSVHRSEHKIWNHFALQAGCDSLSKTAKRLCILEIKPTESNDQDEEVSLGLIGNVEIPTILTPKQTLDKLASDGDFQQFTAHLKAYPNVLPDIETWRSALDAGNLHLLKYLLHPANKFTIPCQQITLPSHALGYHLVVMTTALRTAINACSKNNNAGASSHFKEAARHHAPQFYLYVEYLLLNQANSGLSEPAYLLMAVNETIQATPRPHSQLKLAQLAVDEKINLPIETIQTLLEKAQKEFVRQGNNKARLETEALIAKTHEKRPGKTY